jgi:hypothetical protein
MVRVHGKVVNLYCNTNVEGAAEREWARETVAAWRSSILGSNEALAAAMAEEPETGGGGGVMSRVLRGALIGAVIGGIFGVIQALRKKKG